MNQNLIFMTQAIHSLKQTFIFTREEQDKIIKQSYQHPLGFLIRFLLFTGIKAEEFLLLTFSNINPASSELDIPIILNPTNGSYHADSSVEFRTVPIPSHAFIELSDWRFMKIRNWGIALSDISHMPIATTVEGNSITIHELQRFFCEILNACDMVYYPLSALRDTYAVRSLESGMDPQHLDIILGDHNATNTYIYYITTIASLGKQCDMPPIPKA